MSICLRRREFIAGLGGAWNAKYLKIHKILVSMSNPCPQRVT
jgi:hypothetical protein